MAASPGKFGSPKVWFLLDGYNLLAAKVKSLRVKQTAVTEPTQGLGDGSEEHTPTGVTAIELAQGGAFFDTSTNGMHAALSASVPTSPQAVARIACLGFAGQTIGEPFIGIEGVFSTEYEPIADNGKLTKANAGYKASGALDRGSILQHLTAKTADWDTLLTSVDYTLDSSQRVVPITSNSQANPTVVTTPVAHGLTSGDKVLISGVATSSPTINGSRTVTVIGEFTFSVPVDTSAGAAGTGGSFVKVDSANGGVGYLQVTAYSGLDSAAIKIQDSPDDSTYVDLLSFASVTAGPNKERKTVAGVVDRYLAVVGDVTGTGSVTAFVGFARR